MTVFEIQQIPLRPMWSWLAKTMEIGDRLHCVDGHQADTVRRALYEHHIFVRRVREDGKIFVERTF